ncbi:MAG: putative protein N(5)-glutamine methyltransferase [Solirubrobacterales bacterium]|nr:putative protein N(5)-glutamine methyltransferase [Solirubrobacterales bacterium]
MDDLVDRLRAAGSVFAEDEARLLDEAAGTPAELESMARRRMDGEPLQQILGWAEFCGLRIRVEPGVFLPRHRTEFLVEKAIGLGRRGDVAVDLCCGSGAIGVAVAVGLGGVDLHAADLDPAAVRCAGVNVDEVGGRVYLGDLYEPLPRSLRGRVDLLLVNAPYVPTGEIHLMPREARLHEEPVTLDGGADGLDLQRRVIAGAPSWLAPGGRVLVETSDRQAEATMELMTKAGLRVTLATSAELMATVAIGVRSKMAPDGG